MQTLAITGATGFLGRHLVTECLLQNRFNLRLLTRKRNAAGLSANDKVTICGGDLLEPGRLSDFLSPDCTLIHLAYMNGRGAANIEAIHNIIDVARRAGIKRVVHCSTAVVVGGSFKGVVDERTEPEPRDEYQRTKLKIEEVLKSELTPDIELAILRPTEIIGPGGAGLAGMIRRMQSDNRFKRFVYHCALKNRRFNYISVCNVAAALLFLATVPDFQNGDIYNISDDDDDDNNYAAVERIICSCLNIKHDYTLDIGLPRSLLTRIFKLMPNCSSPDIMYSCDKIKSLGYKKIMKLRSAVSEIVSAQLCKANA